MLCCVVCLCCVVLCVCVCVCLCLCLSDHVLCVCVCDVCVCQKGGVSLLFWGYMNHYYIYYIKCVGLILFIFVSLISLCFYLCVCCFVIVVYMPGVFSLSVVVMCLHT